MLEGKETFDFGSGYVVELVYTLNLKFGALRDCGFKSHRTYQESTMRKVQKDSIEVSKHQDDSIGIKWTETVYRKESYSYPDTKRVKIPVVVFVETFKQFIKLAFK